jgi:hypothetical protein
MTRLMTPFLSAALLLTMSGTSFAQEWADFAALEDRFAVNFPGQPAITETTWTSQVGVVLPARVYSGMSGAGKYSVTAVDYNPMRRILEEKSRHCPPGAETCAGIHDWGLGYWKIDTRGAVVYAVSKLLRRNVTITNMMANYQDLVAGQELQLTNNADQSRIYASVYMHENRLVILEATVPKGYPPPTIFQQSLGWLDEKGVRVRYSLVYYNEPDFPKPAIRGR